MTNKRQQQLSENIEQLELWMKSPESARPDMPAGMHEYLDRLRLAHAWLERHGSFKKVVPMLVTHHRAAGRKTYSESTARRDIQDAQRLFHTVTPDTGRWVTGFMLDNLCELFDSAVRAHKHKEAAQIALVMTKYIEMAQKYAVLDLERMDQPVPRLVEFAPDEAGVEYDPAILQTVEIWKQKREKRKAAKGTMVIQDAQVENGDPLPS